MNQAPRSHNILGAIAFSVCFVSAAVHGEAFYLFHNLAHYREGLPSYMFEGAAGFSLCAPVWLVMFAALGLGIIGAIFLIAACFTKHHALLSPLHIGAFVFLFPTGYTTYRLLMLILN